MPLIRAAFFCTAKTCPILNLYYNCMRRFYVMGGNLKKLVWVCIFVVLVTVVACSKGHAEHFDCRSFEAATLSMQVMLGQLGTLLEASPLPDEALLKLQNYIREHKTVIDQCSAYISKEQQNMTADEVMAYHESSIRDERVRLFLDAQDQFQKQATADQMESFNDIANSVYIFFD